MSKPVLQRLLLKGISLFKVLALSFMIGLANVIKQEQRVIEDTHYRIEYHDETADDEPFEDLDE